MIDMNFDQDIFRNRELIIATKHRKEKVIAPLIESALGVKCIIQTDFDTDEFGTFTGEIDRKDDPISTVRKKCIAAMQTFNYDLGIASEGSFGPHPIVGFLKANEEFLIFIDRKHQLEIIAREICNETNLNGAQISTKDDLIQFANQSLFPSHALILRNEANGIEFIQKGITDWNLLLRTFDEYIQIQDHVYVETDMRAMYNPSRMKVIQKAAEKLLAKIKSQCPNCLAPGFDVKKVNSGLTCSLCGFPTKSTLSHTYSCEKCGFSKDVMYPHTKKVEDPTYCDVCNP